MAFPPRTWFSGQLATAAQLNADVRDNLLTLNGGGVVPVGLIALWGAAASLIPAGWGLCDGGGGRLDLRDVFPIGAGNLYAVGATGGASSVTPATHTAHVVTQPAHATHVVGPGSAHPTFGPSRPSGALNATVASEPFGPGSHSGQGLSGAHTHANAALDGTVHAHTVVATLPPYHARAFMQKASSGLSFTTPRTWTTGDVPTAAQFNADLRDNFNYLLALVMPLTGIIMWGNSIATIPTGWQLCDGSNGTPDLRDKFVIGAGGSYAVGATGGAATSAVASHAGHTPTQADPHGSHTVTQPNTHAAVNITAGGVGPGIPLSQVHSGFNVDVHSAHSGFSVGSHSSHGSISILPPFLALAYIQLLSVPTPTTPRTWTTGDTVQANQFNTYIRDNENAILAAQFPVLGIAIWNSSVASIPANYALPFADVFVPGAGGVYSFGQLGGATSATPANHTDHTVSQPSGHGSHAVTQPTDHPAGTTGELTAPGSDWYLNSTSPFAHHLTVDSHDAHAFTVDSHSAHAPITTMPPYKAVAFMERVA